jgi:hypothetical protein
MKVSEARIVGLIAGFFIGYSPILSELAEQIKIVNLILSLIFILSGRKIYGTKGGALYGLGIGITLGVILESIISL